MRRHLSWVFVALLLAATFAWLACSAEESTLKDVSFMAGFKPQANLPFVAVYVAQEKGYFAEQGLKVKIRHSTGEHLKLLMAGDVDVTTADAGSVLKQRANNDLPIVAFALFGQRGQQAFVVLDEAGIRSPKDWEGRRFGYKVSVPPDYLAILKASGVDRSKIQEVRVGFDPRILTEGKIDILAVFKSNEPDTLARLGFGVSIFDAADYEVPTMGLTYIARNALAETDPEMITGFLKATMKGLEFAFESIDETLDIVLTYADQEDREHMRFMLLTEIADAASPLTAQNGLGWMTAEQWQAFHDSLLEHGALTGPTDVSSAFTDRFISETYTSGKLNWP